MKCAFLWVVFRWKPSHPSLAASEDEITDDRFCVALRRSRDPTRASVLLCLSSALMTSLGALTVAYEGMFPIGSLLASLWLLSSGALSLAFGFLNINNAQAQRPIMAQFEKWPSGTWNAIWLIVSASERDSPELVLLNSAFGSVLAGYRRWLSVHSFVMCPLASI
jgi:hypothetical protein